MNYATVLKNVEEHVTVFFIKHDNPALYYHNISHTKDVVNAVIKITGHYELDERTRFILYTAAWFHDIGYPLDRNNHEQNSAELAEIYLKEIEVKEAEIIEIKKCILATKMPQEPNTLLEEIICDADLFYLGTDNFKKNSNFLRKENEALNNNIVPDSFEWRATKIKFFETHNFHTEYCRLLLDKKKLQNLKSLKGKQVKIIVDELDETDSTGIDIVKKKKNKGKNVKRPVRGIETMFRISAANSVRVSEMADNKAHIMISVNSIIISVVLALMVRNMEEYMHLLIPTMMLVTVNIVTIIYAVLATRPRIAEGRFTEKQVEEKSVNLLYFGSFYKMNYPEYQIAVNKMMNDAEFLYGSLTKDIFWQGKVLGRKYKLLRTAYNIFMYGIIITVVVFITTSVLLG